MKENEQIQTWAHMLDEAFDKRTSSEVAEDNALPKDQNEKFIFNDVFSNDDNDKEIEQKFDAIWPKWWNYFVSEVDRIGELDIQGERKDVDDWDMWKIALDDIYVSTENMADNMFEELNNDGEYDDKEVTLKQLIDDAIQKMVDEAPQYCDLDMLKNHGRCVYRGHMHWGGHYPG